VSAWIISSFACASVRGFYSAEESPSIAHPLDATSSEQAKQFRLSELRAILADLSRRTANVELPPLKAVMLGDVMS
jgi:hypothetical protein